MTASEQLATELGELLERYGSRGGWVVVAVTREGPLFARLLVTDAADQVSFAVVVEEYGRPSPASSSPSPL